MLTYKEIKLTKALNKANKNFNDRKKDPILYQEDLNKQVSINEFLREKKKELSEKIEKMGAKSQNL